MSETCCICGAASRATQRGLCAACLGCGRVGFETAYDTFGVHAPNGTHWRRGEPQRVACGWLVPFWWCEGGNLRSYPWGTDARLVGPNGVVAEGVGLCRAILGM